MLFDALIGPGNRFPVLRAEMKEYTREQSAADLAADLAYVRLKSGERPFRPYGEALALPGVSTTMLPRINPK